MNPTEKTAKPEQAIQASAEAHGNVLVPLTLLEDASSAIGNFVSDHGWGDSDMQAMDNLDAYIARHKANVAANVQPKGTEEAAEDLRIALAQRDIAIEGRDREAAKVKAMRAALDFAAGAIGDAIYTEDGLDGDAGQRVLHIITEARELGTFDQQQFGALDHLCPFDRAEKAEAALAAVQSPAPAPEVADERAAFEASHELEYPAASFRRNINKLGDGNYLCGLTQSAWEGWKARASQAPAVVDGTALSQADAQDARTDWERGCDAYNKWCNEQDIHCNRLPSFRELDAKEQTRWVKRAAMQAGKGQS